jgi:adenosylcobinamide-GDP ribazoletransferase
VSSVSPETGAPERSLGSARTGGARLGGLGPAALRGAFSFLTVLPLGGTAPAPRLGRAWFPLVGVAVGAASGGVYLGAAAALPRAAAAVLALGTAALLTGGLHLDGLMDAADGLLGGGTPEERMRAMREPGVGAFGVSVGILVLLGDAACLASLGPGAGMAALVVAGGLSRLTMLCSLVVLPYVRRIGLGTAARGRGAVADLLVGSACSAAACLFAGPWAAVAAGAAAIGGLAVSALAARRIGGATGDVYGAVVEISQLGALLAFAAVR